MCPLSTSYSVPRKTKKLEPLYIKGSRSGLYWTRTSDPIDVNDVLWAIGQVVKLKYGCEHTSEALEIWAFFTFWAVFTTPVFRVCSAVFTGREHGGVQVCSGCVHGFAVFIFR